MTVPPNNVAFTPPYKKRDLSDLSPTEFEHLIFDLMVARGMANVTWRTPGADGGRDIEGTIFEQDFTGLQTSKKWYVECKRYTSSVDWPTIYGKIAYADSNQADVLLLCTSSLFTPTAVTHVDNWNRARKQVSIRLWPKHELELRLQQHPDLLLKYGLSDTPSTPGATFVSLALALSKSVSSHYSKLIFEDEKPDLMLQASNALAYLLLVRMEDIEREGRINPRPFRPTSELLENWEFEGTPPEIDDLGATAFLAYLTALTKSKLKIKAITSDSSCIAADPALNLVEIVTRYKAVFSAIATWGDFEYTINNSDIMLRSRK